MAEQDKNVNQTPAQGKTDKPAKKKDAQPNAVVRFFRRIGKWLRDLRSEAKKVVWPTWKQVVNNTGVVIATVLLVGIVISLFSFAAQQGISLLINLVN